MKGEGGVEAGAAETICYEQSGTDMAERGGLCHVSLWYFDQSMSQMFYLLTSRGQHIARNQNDWKKKKNVPSIRHNEGLLGQTISSITRYVRSCPLRC